MAILCFDYGHGGRDPGAIYAGRKEKDDVLEVGKLVACHVRRHGVIVDEIRNSDRTISLKERSSYENKKKYDFFISFHRNAYKPEKARGVETYIYLRASPRAKALAGKIQRALVGLGFIDRGVKTANFHMLRETRAPAVLLELGFIDNSLDNKIFVEKKGKIVEAISKAILKELNIGYKDKKTDVDERTLYRVVTGAFKERENAEKRIKDLKKAGFDSHISL